MPMTKGERRRAREAEERANVWKFYMNFYLPALGLVCLITVAVLLLGQGG